MRAESLLDTLRNTQYSIDMASVVLSPDARRQLDELPFKMHARVHAVLERLAKWPDISGAKPLRGELAGQFRLRTGDYRVQFSVSGKGAIASVRVTRIGHRDGFYEQVR